MTITTTQTVTLLGQRVGKLLAAVGLTESSSDMVDAINYALRELGYSVTDHSEVSNADLSSVTDANVTEFLDTAELRQLETLLNEVTVKVTVAVGPRREELSHISDALIKVIDQKRKQLQAEYGRGLSALEGATIGLRFAETNSTTS